MKGLASHEGIPYVGRQYYRSPFVTVVTKFDILRSNCGGSDNVIRMELLEHFIRDDLNANAPRTMVVLRPLKVLF